MPLDRFAKNEKRVGEKGGRRVDSRSLHDFFVTYIDTCCARERVCVRVFTRAHTYARLCVHTHMNSTVNRKHLNGIPAVSLRLSLCGNRNADVVRGINYLITQEALVNPAFHFIFCSSRRLTASKLFGSCTMSGGFRRIVYN